MQRKGQTVARPSRYAQAWGWEAYFVYTAEQSAAEEGEKADMIERSQRWAREARQQRYDPLAEAEARYPITRFLSGAGSVGVEVGEEQMSFPNRGEG